MDISSYAPGQFAWADLATTDLTAASTFYAALLGWSIDEIADPAPGSYAMCRLEGSPVAGLVQTSSPPASPQLWTSYVAVDDVDATAALIQRAGGRVLIAPRNAGGAGRMALAADRDGATFALWQAGGHAGAGRVNEPGTLCWNELQGADPDTAAAFYGEVFGWDAQRVDAGGTPYVVFSLDGRDNAGLLEPGQVPRRDLPAHWMVYFAVTDTDAAAARAADVGGNVAVAPFDYGGTGRAAVLHDPQGYAFSLMTMATQAGDA